ncbi:MAG TPA: nuclear transport factor 2 family protein [Candidatus Acidoferrum sp.]|nr:nuclear transport factor 2 family protein [Candidatus Acidoferrum sp.]
MKKVLGAILLVCACVGLVYAQASKTPAKAPAGPSISDSVKQLEHDWTDGMIAGDTDKIGAILADDWVSVGADGKTETKTAFLAEIKSGTSKMISFDFGPMTVKVVGSVAIVQGSDTEKSTDHGKDTSGKYIWMDVFANRNGKWQAVRSLDAMVK